MKTFVDLLGELKEARLKNVNRDEKLREAWTFLEEQRGHTLRALKTDLRNTLYETHKQLRVLLEYSVFTVDTYVDSDSVRKVSIKVAFVPSSGKVEIDVYEHMMFHTLIQSVQDLGLESLVNDICVNSLQHRFSKAVS